MRGIKRFYSRNISISKKKLEEMLDGGLAGIDPQPLKWTDHMSFICDRCHGCMRVIEVFGSFVKDVVDGMNEGEIIIVLYCYKCKSSSHVKIYADYNYELSDSDRKKVFKESNADFAFRNMFIGYEKSGYFCKRCDTAGGLKEHNRDHLICSCGQIILREKIIGYKKYDKKMTKVWVTGD